VLQDDIAPQPSSGAEVFTHSCAGVMEVGAGEGLVVMDCEGMAVRDGAFEGNTLGTDEDMLVGANEGRVWGT
jgi:hypothetical protein